MNNLYNQVRSYLSINTSSDKRKYGFRDACSRLVELNETIQLPKGYRLSTSKDEEKYSSAAAFEGSIHQQKNNIEIHQKLTLNKRIYEANDWKGFRDALLAHKNFGDYLIIKR